jgi:hypothetical protein
MNPKDLRCYAFCGALRIYEDYALPGYEAVVTTADHEAVTLLTHNLIKTFELRLTWPNFVKMFAFRADATAEKQALLLRNTLRTIATKADTAVAVVLERYLDQPPSLDEVTVTEAKKSPYPAAVVRADYYRHTCLELARTETTVTYLPLEDGTLDVCEAGVETFDEEFTHVMPDYPVAKAAQLYVQFALHLGATPAAMKALSAFVNITKKEHDMATAKPVTTGTPKPAPAVKNAAKDEKKGPPAAKKATTKPATKPAAAEAGKKEPKGTAAEKNGPPTTKAPKEPTERKATASSRFQELIMAGKLTDDEIFAAVKKEFGLGDDKRSYVSWYRNHLAKKGKNPPAAKEAKKAA